MKVVESDKEQNFADSEVLKSAFELNDISFSEMVESIKDIVSHYVVDRTSTRIVVRKFGYNGFTVAFTYFRGSGKWSVDGWDNTPEGLLFMINNYGKQLEDDSEFYKASKSYSQQEYGLI